MSSILLITAWLCFCLSPLFASGFKLDNEDINIIVPEVSLESLHPLGKLLRKASVPTPAPTSAPALTPSTVPTIEYEEEILRHVNASTPEHADPLMPQGEPTLSLPDEPNITYAFQIKMYWERGVVWQGRRSRKQYCIQCANDCRRKGECRPASCTHNRELMLNECDATGRKQYWIYKDGRFHPETEPNICWTMDADVMRLLRCDPLLDSKQIFTPVTPTESFQIRPRDQFHNRARDAKCVTNQHHPKSEEPLYMDSCRKAQENDDNKNDDTSRYVIGIGWRGHTGKGNWDEATRGFYPAGGTPSGFTPEGGFASRGKARNNAAPPNNAAKKKQGVLRQIREETTKDGVVPHSCKT